MAPNDTAPNSATPNSATRNPERGSAYVVTLMVLFILSIIGVSLTLITQTETLLGSNERTIQRTFYSATSGIDVAVARMLIDGDFRPTTYELADVRSTAGGMFDRDSVLLVEDQVDVSPFVQILASPCNLCQINQGNEFFELNHAITSTATRTGAPVTGPPDEIPIARKTVAGMVEIQPWRQSSEAFNFTAEQLTKVKF